MDRRLESYLDTLKSLTDGDLEGSALGLRALRAEPDRNDMRKLLTTRLSLKVEGAGDDAATASGASDPFVQAEEYFVEGLRSYHGGKWIAGIEAFERAAELYLAGPSAEKHALAKFNAFIGRVNAEPELEVERQILLLGELQKTAQACGNLHVLGLIHRQKAYAFTSLGRFHAALDQAERAVLVLEQHGPHSDHQLARLAAADASLEAGDALRARAHFEQVVAPIETRVLLGYDYLRARLGEPSSLEPARYAYRCPHFIERWTAWKSGSGRPAATSPAWDAVSGQLRCSKTGRTVSVRPNSLEGQVLGHLAQGGESKASLCEKLWPDFADLEHLDNRLHRLLSRLNKKIGGRISFDGKRYRLS